MQTVREEKAVIEVREGVFYNPKMEINRDLLSAALTCLNVKTFCDGHTATGIKAVRGSLENECIECIDAIDLSKIACQNASKNAELNGVRNIRIANNDVRLVLMKNNYDFVEIDPFGSPAPFIYALAESLSWRKKGYFSLTATDTAVLCGAEPKACRRIYGAVPLHEEIVHEIGLRILVQKVQSVFAEKNLAVRPLMSLSHRHYLKVFFECTRDAKMCDANIKQLMFFAYCAKCGGRRYVVVGEDGNCKECGAKAAFAGPVWSGLLNDDKFLICEERELGKRAYANMKEEVGIITKLRGENFEGLCYDLHKIFRGKSIPKTNMLIEALKKNGWKAERTIYKEWIIRTDANAKEIKRTIN